MPSSCEDTASPGRSLETNLVAPRPGPAGVGGGPSPGRPYCGTPNPVLTRPGLAAAHDVVQPSAMSTKAQAILEEIRALPPGEQAEVRNGLLQLQERQRQWEQQRAALQRLRRSSEGLLKALLDDRARERARG